MTKNQEAAIAQAITDGAKQAGLDLYLQAAENGTFDTGELCSVLRFAGRGQTPDEMIIIKTKEV
jgi:hypothetical protein